MKLISFLFCLFAQVFLLNSSENISEKKILICGICKNAAKGFRVVYEGVNKLIPNFLDYRVIVYENNSIDLTKHFYKKWALINPKVIFLTEDLSVEFLKNYIPKIGDFRIGYISRARNIILDEINKPSYNDFDYVMMVDLDDFSPWDIENILKTINDPEQEWDAVFANGFYDKLAFRTNECFIGPEIIGFQLWYKKCVPIYSEKWKSLIDEGRWIPVKSAFGGLAIYKKKSIKNCRYKGLIDKELYERQIKNCQLNKDIAFQKISSEIYQTIINSYKFYMRWEKELFDKNSKILKEPMIQTIYICEHINFHEDMIKNGHDKLFINPKIKMIQK